MKRLLVASVAPNTLKAYNTGLQCFSSFREQYGLHQSWPPTVEQLAMFLSYMSLKGLSSKTADLYITAISFQCKVSDLPDNTKHFLINKLAEGFRRQGGSKRVRLPITFELLKSILTTLPVVCCNGFEAALFKAVYVLAYFGFFRVGEITVANKSTMEFGRVLNLGDISFVNGNQYMLVNLRFSKTDQLGKGTVLKISKTGSSICPVIILRQYLRQRPKVAGPLFCHFDGKPLTRYQFSSVLQKVIKLINPQLQGFRSHSFRIGAATRAAQLGWPIEKIKEAGRWASEAYRSYIHSQDKYREIMQLS